MLNIFTFNIRKCKFSRGASGWFFPTVSLHSIFKVLPSYVCICDLLMQQLPMQVCSFYKGKKKYVAQGFFPDLFYNMRRRKSFTSNGSVVNYSKEGGGPSKDYDDEYYMYIPIVCRRRRRVVKSCPTVVSRLCITQSLPLASILHNNGSQF